MPNRPDPQSTSRLPPLREMIAGLVREPSISSTDAALDQPNEAVSDRIADWANAAGFRVRRMPVPDRPGKLNVACAWGPTDFEGSAGLVLSGHTDTVPTNDADWSSDPFTLTEREGLLYGLGVADMKSFVALALTAARRIDPDRLRSPLIVLGTADEESGMDGARALVDAGEALGQRAIIGEPTGGVPIRMHKGVMMQSVHLIGRAGHSSDPSLGASALDGLHAVLGALAEVRREWAGTHAEPAFAVPAPTLNFGHCHGGDAPNRIAASAELTFDIRVVPGMDPDAIRELLTARIDRALEGTGVAATLADLCPPVPPFAARPDSELVATLESITGQRARTVAFGTEAPFLMSLGMDTVVMGPGSIDVAHQPDEHLAIAELEPAVALLERLILKYCGHPDAAGASA